MLTDVEELIIRKAIGTKTATVETAGFVIPAPIFFVDKADFFATVQELLEQKQIETTPIAFCCISFLKFTDSPSEGCGDQPLVRILYNFYFFRQYDLEREDESEVTPDAFLKTTLKSYNAFIKTILEARNEFLGVQDLVSSDLPENFDVKTSSLKQTDFVEESDICRYIPGVKGHSIDLTSEVSILINESNG